MADKYVPKDPKKDPRDEQDQEQDQDQKQDQKQDQLQAQLQGQAQGQGQFQFAVQSLESESKNENDNDNKNENESKNENDNDNKNENENKNENKNEVKNELDNEVKNEVDNDVDNKVENHVENKVDTEVNVDVKIDLDLSSLPDDKDVIDIDWIDDTTGSVIMPDVVDQKLEGDDNIFNIDQVNNLYDVDVLVAPTVDNYGDWDGSAFAGGGFSDIGGVEAKIEGDRSSIGDVATSTADGLASNTAFNQNIVMGANIQFNNIEMSVAGHNLDNDDSLDA